VCDKQIYEVVERELIWFLLLQCNGPDNSVSIENLATLEPRTSRVSNGDKLASRDTD
jgi:hypothetical protein